MKLSVGPIFFSRASIANNHEITLLVDKKIEKLTLNDPTHFFISRLRQNLKSRSDRNLELIKKIIFEKKNFWLP